MRSNPVHPGPVTGAAVSGPAVTGSTTASTDDAAPWAVPGRRRHRGRAGGFTLMELLMVVLIIGVLVSIILPTVSKARQQAQAANSRAQLANLATLITAYHADFQAYPGPLTNLQVYADMNGTAPAIVDGTAPNSVKLAGRADFITMSENLVLGLNGGLRNVNGEIRYDTAWVGGGPQWLGGTPKNLPAYGENSTKDLSTRFAEAAIPMLTGDYIDSNGVTGDDSPVPEYQDRFNEPLPVIYMRARAGSRSTADDPDDNAVVTDGTDPARRGQYDYSQYAAYVSGEGGTIGVGRSAHPSEYVPASDYLGPKGTPDPKHGLRIPVAVGATTDPSSTGYTYPYNAYAALWHHGLSGPAGPPETPKQKDTYILISAGIDRIYGTSDDITNFGGY